MNLKLPSSFSLCICLFIVSISFSFPVYAQVKTLESKITSLEMEIVNSSGGQRLQYLDKLTLLVEHQSKYGYEALVHETINLALDLDSINIAAKHTGMLILFLTNRKERPEDGLQVFQNFSKNLAKVSDNSILIELLLRGASSCFYSGRGQESLEWYDQAIELAIIEKDSTRYGKALSYKAFALSEMGDFIYSLQEYQKSLDLFNPQKDSTHILTTKVGLSILYGKNAFYEESLEELAYVEEVSRLTANYPVYIMSQIIIASNHYLSGNYDKAIIPLKEAIRLSEEHPEYSSSITTSYKTLANTYSKMDSLDLARKMINKIHSSTNTDKLVEINFLDAQMNLFFAEKSYPAADSVGVELLNLIIDSLNYEDILSTLEVLFKVNHAMGNFNKELIYFKKHTHIKDSVNNIRKLNAFSYYQTLYETEKQYILIANQNTEIKLLDAKNREQFQWILLIGISLFSSGIYFYFSSRRNKEQIELEKTKRELALEKMKATLLENNLLNKRINYKIKDLTNFAVEIQHNKMWAKILLEKFENIKNWKSQGQEFKDLGNEIRDKATIDIEISELQSKIEQVGSEFYDKLNVKASNLSKAERRLCCFIRMKLSPKQIASLNNITHTSVITSRYRLRRKLALNSNEDLDSFIHNL